MDKNVIMAIALSFVILVGFSFVQKTYFSNDEEIIISEETVENLPVETEENTSAIENNNVEISTIESDVELSSAPLKFINGETDLYRFNFTTEGAELTSLELKEHKDGENLVNMVVPGNTGRNAFEIAFGRNINKPLNNTFYYIEDSDPNTYSFYQDLTVSYGDGSISEPFRLIKKFRFVPGEYMLEVEITLENSINDYIPLNYNGMAYTLTYGPHIGPSYTKLDGRSAYRNLITFSDGKLSTYNNNRKNKSNSHSITEFVEWSGIVGKYFGVAAISNSSRTEITLSNESIEGMAETTFLSLSRPTIESSRNSDVYRFFIGPKDKKILEIYDNPGENYFEYDDLNLGAMSKSSAVLGWLEFLLKKLLELLYFVIPNYGVGIILMTLIVKIVLFPITHKSYESTSKMSAIQPKMKEIQEKFKDDPQRLNKELSALYQKEGVNPMSGCLPMVLQMPILFAVYGMLNKYFDLRGAMFIPGWITDLSAPESIFTFSNFVIPILKSSDIRLLPIIYVASQLISMKFTQSNQAAASGQSAMQQKMFMYVMPLMFFFILYNVSSGLLIYWIVMNVLTTTQQVVVNHLKNKKQN